MYPAVRTAFAAPLLLAMLASSPSIAQVVAPVTPVTPVVPVVPVGPIVITKVCVPNANPAAYLVSPALGDTVKSKTLRLSWCSDSSKPRIPGMSRTVQIHLSKSSSFASGAEEILVGGLDQGHIVLLDRLDSTTITLPSAGTWYWRIRTLHVIATGDLQPYFPSTIAANPWSDTSRFVSAPPGIVIPIGPIVIGPVFRIVCRDKAGHRTYEPASGATVAAGSVRLQWCLDTGSVNPLPIDGFERWQVEIVGSPKPDTIRVESRIDTASVNLPLLWSGFKWRVRRTSGFKADPVSTWSPWSQATLTGQLSVRSRTSRLDGFRPVSALLVSPSGRTLASYALVGDLPEPAILASWSRSFPSATFVALKNHDGEFRTVPLRGYGLGR